MTKRTLHLVWLLSVPILSSPLAAQTTIQGDISGVWASSGNPYYILADSRVPAGKTLTLKPGVHLVFYDGVTMYVDGQLIAEGTPSDRIRFDALNAESTWNTIKVSGSGSNPPTSRFAYCDFANAQTALHLYIQGNVDNEWTTMQVNISHSTFRASGTAVLAEAYGYNIYQYGTPRRRHAKLNLLVNACTFDGTSSGIDLFIHGSCNVWCGGAASDPIVTNNVFRNISGVAFNVRDASGSGQPQFTNNTVGACGHGLLLRDPLNTTVTNNIFAENGVAVERTGSDSDVVFRNCFFNNETDFVKYPASYGDPVIYNENGTQCDLGFNIFVDPQFAEDRYHLTAQSPAIDAGTEENAPAVDIDGEARPIGARYDMGADEFGGSFPMVSPSPSATETREGTPTATATHTPTATATHTPTATATYTATHTPTSRPNYTATRTPAVTSTYTPISGSPQTGGGGCAVSPQYASAGLTHLLFALTPLFLRIRKVKGRSCNSSDFLYRVRLSFSRGRERDGNVR
jgi:hypothetical protein